MANVPDPTLASNASLDALIDRLHEAAGGQDGFNLTAKRLRAHVAACGDQFPPGLPGIEAAYADLRRRDAFARKGIASLRKRFPELRSHIRPGGTLSWSVLVRHALPIGQGLAINETRAASPALAAHLGSMALGSDGPAARDALAGLMRREATERAAEAAPTLERWRAQARALVDDAADPAEIETALRRLLKASPVETAIRPHDTLDAALGRTVGKAARLAERDTARERFRAVVGYADHVERVKASRLPRRIVFHVGPTNSGKTHDAMEALSRAGDGCYLAPLRLLALEGYERLARAGLAAGMVTGEESIDEDGATHLAMTIEMATLGRRWEVAVIDEVQMLLDPDRGWAWTRALIGLRCDTLHLCGSPDALPLVEKAAAILGETVELVRHERKVPLVLEPGRATIGTVVPGDAVVAFSRRQVLFFREILLDRGLTVAAVYGSLSPEVRRAEAERFRSGEAEVLVATDAIGMGLNLGPLRRVVFTEIEKYDGRAVAPLTPSEIRQIAGRAGRYGHHAEGRVATMAGGHGRIRKALEGIPDPGAQDGLFLVRPEAETLGEAAREIRTDSLCAVLREFESRTVYAGSHYKASALQETIQAAQLVDGLPLTIADKYHFATCPLDRRNDEARGRLLQFARVRAAGGRMGVPPRIGPTFPRHGYGLLENEAEVRLMSAYLWLHRRFPGTFVEPEAASARRREVNLLIERELGSKVEARARRVSAAPRP